MIAGPHSDGTGVPLLAAAAEVAVDGLTRDEVERAAEQHLAALAIARARGAATLLTGGDDPHTVRYVLEQDGHVMRDEPQRVNRAQRRKAGMRKSRKGWPTLAAFAAVWQADESSQVAA